MNKSIVFLVALCSCQLLSLLTLLAHVSPAAFGYDWPLARGDSAGTGVASGTIPQSPRVLWEFKTESDQAGFEGTPIIAEGKVFAADFEGNVYALDLRTGEPVWKSKAKDGIVSPGAYRDGHLILGDFGTGVYCFDTKDGREIWYVDLEQQVINGGNFIGEEVLLSTETGALVALDIKSGKQKWSYETGDQLRSTASLWKEIAMLGGCDSKLHKINVQEGTPVREGTPLMAPTLSTPNIIGDVAIVPTQPGTVLAVQAETGEIVWNFQPDGGMNSDIRSSSATQAQVVDGKLEGIVVVPSRNRRLIGLDAATGELKWEAILKKRSDASPVICDGRAWIGASDGMLYAIGLEDGKETWSYQLSGPLLASPAISDNKVVIATEKGNIVCFGE